MAEVVKCQGCSAVVTAMAATLLLLMLLSAEVLGEQERVEVRLAAANHYITILYYISNI